jgi:hypothetical protein
VRSKNVRFTSLFVVLAAALAVSGIISPGAFGLEGYTATFTADPTAAIKGQTITSVPLDQEGTPVTVEVTPPVEQSANGLTVTLTFATGPGLETTENIDGNVATTDELGVATFDNLTIGDPNEGTLTDYQFIAEVTAPSEVILSGVAFADEAPLSEPFDIWDAGCKGNGNGCSILLRNGLDTYNASGNAVLTASSLSQGVLPNLSCPKQRLIFSTDLFSHATDGSAGVSLLSHITKNDFRAAGTNYGQSHVEWCIGLLSSGPWIHNGAAFTQQDTDNDGTLDLFVASAPKCPKKKTASTFAPCIVSQVSDGKGGSITRGWLLGGDPPRRT